MSESKQTAVRWLEQEFLKLEQTVGVYGIMYELIEKAKAMEKEQIENAYNHMRCVGNFENGEQYYNETFKSE